ncbi:MAG: Spo0B domain-containing protein, partial [Treponema sp.]|nr:Spo0B domain-containing protein [Treponema sp.]
SLNAIRKQIKRTQLILILFVTVFMSAGGMFITIRANEREFNDNLMNTSRLITRLYGFTSEYDREQLKEFMDDIVLELSGVDIISIVDVNGRRIYHTHHELVGTQYDGTIPDFSIHNNGFYTEDDIGPSGPQRRTYSAVYDASGKYDGFIMTIMLKSSMMQVTLRIVLLFLFVTIIAIVVELAVSGVLFNRIKKEFISFTEDFEGTKILVDSMRANNHDFTNKLHVILGLIQIGEYDKAASYIQNISMIQKETISRVMNSIENPSFAALIVGKIARASECDVRFILKEGICFHNQDIDIPSEALVTITGNLIDNALDEMNRMQRNFDAVKELTLGVYTKPGSLLITVQDTGGGIPLEIRDKIFELGVTTKGEGHGTGLFHTKQLVQSMGGNISFETEDGCGTCFMVELNR